MALDFVWWCNECEQEIDTPEEHSQIYPSHTYIEKMRWTGYIITPIVPEVVQEAIDDDITTISGILQTTIEEVSETLETVIEEAINVVSDYYYISDDRLKSTTSTSWVNRLTLSVEIENEGWYRIGWDFIWNYSHTSKIAGFQIIIDDDEKNPISEYYIEPKDSNKNKRFPLCGFKPIFLNKGDHAIEIKMRSCTNGKTVRIYSATLEAQKISV